MPDNVYPRIPVFTIYYRNVSIMFNLNMRASPCYARIYGAKRHKKGLNTGILYNRHINLENANNHENIPI